MRSRSSSPNIRALESNVWSLACAIGSGADARVLDTPTRLVVETPVPNPPYNCVWRFYDDGSSTLDDQIAPVLGRFRDRGVPAMWFVHPTAPEGLGDALRRAGLERADELVGMARSLDDLEAIPRPPDGIVVREANADDTNAWVDFMSWRYGLDPASTSPYLREIFQKAIATGRVRLWIAYLDTVPVSKAAIHIHDGVAGVYGVATTEAGRGRGLARLLTLEGLHAARDQGIRTSVLHSTAMARSLYERLQYQGNALFQVWADPGTPHF